MEGGARKKLFGIANRIEKMSNELIVYHREQLAIMSSGQMDIELRRNTQNPSLGIEFFVIDDEHFQDSFQDQRYEKMVYIRGRNREETVYCSKSLCEGIGYIFRKIFGNVLEWWKMEIRCIYRSAERSRVWRDCT